MFRICAAGVALALAAVTTAAAAPPPASAFGRLPAIEIAAISPDGQKIALLGGTADHRIISIAPIDGTQAATVDLGRADISALRWAGDGYLLVRSTILDKGVYSGTGVKYAYRISRDFILTPDGKSTGYLLKDNVAAQFSTSLPILRVTDGPKPVAIVEGRDWTAANLSTTGSRFKPPDDLSVALWRVDVATGAGHLLERGQPETKSYAVDLQGEPRARIDYDDKGRFYRLLVRGKNASGWKPLVELSDRDGAPSLLGYSDPEDAVYLEERQPDGTVHVVRHKLADGATTSVGEAHDAGLLIDEFSGAPVAIIDEALGYQWLDPQLGATFAKLARALPGKTIAFESWSRDRTRIVVSVYTSDTPVTWYLLDSARGELSLVGESFPELNGAEFGSTSFYSYRARDGLSIPAYLTLPPGQKGSARKPPLIVLPHDGPALRNGDGFSWLVQFLATRGYAVLQPQFRGSSGFSPALERAGDHEWGGKMQTDLLDGVADLVSKGQVEPGKACIVGFGYGGYAALAGVTFVGDAYRCAVAINGVSDLTLLYGELTRSYSPDSPNVIDFKRTVADTASAAAQTSVISPAHQADKGRAPVLLIASAGGTEDTPYEQSTTMRDALQHAGRPVAMITLDHDDDLSTSASRTQALEAIEAFLAKNLPVN